MGRTNRQRQTGFGNTGKKLTSKYGSMVKLGTNGPTVVQPKRLPPGWQNTSIKVPTSVVTCAEDGCQIFLNDRIDPVTEKIIKAGTKPCGAIHRQWNGREPMYVIQYSGDIQPRVVTRNQYIDELCAGIDLALGAIKQGSYESSRKS